MLKPRMPYLVEVAAALLASKLGSGGLECDLGNVNDIITSKRPSLGGGFAKVSMMLKLNKHPLPYDPEILILLDNSDWENHIPKHPIFDEEMHIEDDDGSLIENDEQQ
jgi:hypothetical protein